MSHHLTIGADGRAEMAFVGATPWTGLGQRMRAGAPIEEWQRDSGMAWLIKRAPVSFTNDSLHVWPANEVLYRSDTNMPLSIVSKNYKIVQPAEVLEFFRTLVAHHGFEIETAGTLKGGRRFWALARTGFEGEVVPGDVVSTYMLIFSSCDGSLATGVSYTSIRTVCWNTLQMALAESRANRVSVRHNTEFDAEKVKVSFGLGANAVYDNFLTRMKTLANTSLSEGQAAEIIAEVIAKRGVVKPVRETFGFKTVMQLFNGVGKGARLDGVAGTAWGLINAVTEYADFHSRSRSQENRLDSAWFGTGHQLKEEALVLLETM